MCYHSWDSTNSRLVSVCHAKQLDKPRSMVESSKLYGIRSGASHSYYNIPHFCPYGRQTPIKPINYTKEYTHKKYESKKTGKIYVVNLWYNLRYMLDLCKVPMHFPVFNAMQLDGKIHMWPYTVLRGDISDIMCSWCASLMGTWSPKYQFICPYKTSMSQTHIIGHPLWYGLEGEGGT